jgi:ribonuclease P protein component
VVSKKVAKSAPMRNRIRRRIYEQVRLLAPEYLKNHDVVITVYDPELAVIPADEINQIIKRILKSIAKPR